MVTLKANASPSTTTHVVAAQLDERGVVGGAEHRSSCAATSTSRANPCGVCTARSDAAVGGAGDDAVGVDGLDGVDQRDAGHGARRSGAQRLDDALEHRERGEAPRGVVHEHDVDVTDRGQPGRHGVGARGTPGDHHGIRGQVDAGPGRPGGVGELGRRHDDERAPGAAAARRCRAA